MPKLETVASNFMGKAKDEVKNNILSKVEEI